MRRVARGVSITVLSLMALVPIQAAPVSAAGESLNVEPEKVLRISDSTHRLTATVTPVAPDEHVVFDDDDNPLTDPVGECDTDATGRCSVSFTGEDGDTFVIRAYVEDGPPDAFPCPAQDPPLTLDADCAEGQDEGAEPGDQPESPAPDDTDVVTVEFADGSLDVTPEAPVPSFAPNSTVTLTAAVMSFETAPTNPRPLVANVDGEILAGSTNANQQATRSDTECDTDPITGQCSLTYTAGPNQGVDTVRGWVDLNDDPEPQPGEPTDPEADGDEDQTTNAAFEGDATEGADETTTPGTIDETPPDITDVATVNLSANPVLSLTPKSQNKETGQTVTVTASVTQASQPLNNQKIAAIVLSGPNANKVVVCTTGGNGQCPLTFTGGTATGTDNLRATIDADANGQPNEADSGEAFNTAGGTPEPDTTDVVQITWVAQVVPPPPDDEDNPKNQCDSTRTDAEANEIIIGTKGNDKLCGYGGNDTLRGLKGNDKLNGGRGKDNAKGGKGKDRCKAEEEHKSCEK